LLSTIQIARLRKAYIDWLLSLEPTYFVTFNFGYKVSAATANYAIKGLCGQIERLALGRNYTKHRGSHRLVAVGFPEHPDSNPHWHAVVRASEDMALPLDWCGPVIWAELQPRGQLCAEPIEDRQKVISYSTKRLSEAAIENVIFYGQDPPKPDDL
jgi:hypothetical protein